MMDWPVSALVSKAASSSATSATSSTVRVVTESGPLGTFATWQAERAIGDHDRNTLRVRLDPQRDASELKPGMTVWAAALKEGVAETIPPVWTSGDLFAA
jgi:hypothetical protein